MEGLDIAQLFAGTGKLDGLARHGPDRQRRAAAGVAVQLGDNDAVDAQLFIEGFRHIHGVLTGHGVHHQQDFLGMNRRLDFLQLLHQRFVDVQAAGGVDDQHVLAVIPGVLDGFLGGFDGALGALFKHRHAHLLTHHLQLLDSGGAVNIAGGQQGLFALLGEITRQLGGHGGFTGALQAAEHVDRRHRRRPGQLGVAAAHERGQLFVDNFDDLLPGVQVG